MIPRLLARIERKPAQNRAPRHMGVDGWAKPRKSVRVVAVRGLCRARPSRTGTVCLFRYPSPLGRIGAVRCQPPVFLPDSLSETAQSLGKPEAFGNEAGERCVGLETPNRRGFSQCPVSHLSAAPLPVALSSLVWPPVATRSASRPSLVARRALAPQPSRAVVWPQVPSRGLRAMSPIARPSLKTATDTSLRAHRAGDKIYDPCSVFAHGAGVFRLNCVVRGGARGQEPEGT